MRQWELKQKDWEKLPVPERQSVKFHNKKQGKNEKLFNELGEYVEDCLSHNILLTMINF